MAAAANATTTRIGAHLNRRELLLGFISKFHLDTWKARVSNPVVDLVKSAPNVPSGHPNCGLISISAVNFTAGSSSAVGTIGRLAERHGLKVFDVEHLSTNGGSRRVRQSHCRNTFITRSTGSSCREPQGLTVNNEDRTVHENGLVAKASAGAFSRLREHEHGFRG
jgi:hypothetical protein